MKKGIKTALGGFFAGLSNGLFGSGGGLLVLPVLTKLCGVTPRQAHATALLVTLPLSVLTVVIAALRLGLPPWSQILWVTAGMLIGSAGGAFLLGKMKGKWLKIAVSVAMITLGVKLLL